MTGATSIIVVIKQLLVNPMYSTYLLLERGAHKKKTIPHSSLLKVVVIQCQLQPIVY